MKLLLQIDCENAAFEDDCNGEIARILRVAAKIAKNDPRAMAAGTRLRDINGNNVGYMQIDDTAAN